MLLQQTQVCKVLGAPVALLGNLWVRDDLVDDFVAVITSRAARIYGRRNSRRRAEQIRACIEQVIQSEAQA